MYRNILILLGVLIVVVGGYFTVKTIVAKNKVIEKTEAYTVVDVLSIDKIAKVTTTYQGETITYARNADNTWTTVVPEGLKADPYMSRAVAITLAPLKSNKLIEDKVTDVAKYGLDNPSDVLIELNDGKQIRLLVGRKTDTGENYYVKLGDGNKVYTIGSEIISRILHKVYDIKAKELFAVNADNVNKLTMYVGGQKLYSGYKQGQYEWKMDYPLSSTMNLYLFMPVIDDIVALKVDKYITPKYESLDQYGLDAPRYEFIFESLGQSYHVQIGKDAVKDESVYARFADSTEIFTLATSDISFLDKPVTEVMDNYVYVPTIDEVNKIEILIDGKDYKFDYSMTDPKDRSKDVKATLNGQYDVSFKYGEKQWFKMLFLSLINIEVGSTDVTYEPAGTPEVTIIYNHVKDNVVMRLDFYSKDDLYYAVTRNGVKTGILVLKGQFNKTDPENLGLRPVLKILNEQKGL